MRYITLQNIKGLKNSVKYETFELHGISYRVSLDTLKESFKTNNIKYFSIINGAESEKIYGLLESGMLKPIHFTFDFMKSKSRYPGAVHKIIGGLKLIKELKKITLEGMSKEDIHEAYSEVEKFPTHIIARFDVICTNCDNNAEWQEKFNKLKANALLKEEEQTAGSKRKAPESVSDELDRIVKKARLDEVQLAVAKKELAEVKQELAAATQKVQYLQDDVVGLGIQSRENLEVIRKKLDETNGKLAFTQKQNEEIKQALGRMKNYFAGGAAAFGNYQATLFGRPPAVNQNDAVAVVSAARLVV